MLDRGCCCYIILVEVLHYLFRAPSFFHRARLSRGRDRSVSRVYDDNINAYNMRLLACSTFSDTFESSRVHNIWRVSRLNGDYNRLYYFSVTIIGDRTSVASYGDYNNFNSSRSYRIRAESREGRLGFNSFASSPPQRKCARRRGERWSRLAIRVVYWKRRN